ncbi:MAG TPA: 2-dehydropantoate 2-reductase N-terminal domain-containing protein, partial [Armatimonadota bacterium]
MQINRIAILGAGSWGTALTLLLAKKGYSISLWAWDPAQAETIRNTHENPFMPGLRIPEDVSVTSSIPECVHDADLIIFVTISSAASSVATELKSCIPAGVPVVTATKGLNSETGLTISQTLAAILPRETPICAISGPNLAVEVARGVPTATVAACENAEVAKEIQNVLMCPTLRVYTNSDVIGVELAGALKNVIAIGAGISDGLGFGD